MSKTELKRLVKDLTGISIWKLERDCKREQREARLKTDQQAALVGMEQARGVREADDDFDTEVEWNERRSDGWGALTWEGDPYVKAYT